MGERTATPAESDGLRRTLDTPAVGADCRCVTVTAAADPGSVGLTQLADLERPRHMQLGVVMPWWTWALLLWLFLAVGVALVSGAAIGQADPDERRRVARFPAPGDASSSGHEARRLSAAPGVRRRPPAD